MTVMTLRASLTHHHIGVSKQIVLEGTGLVERGKQGPNDHMFEDPAAQHIFLNVSGLTREAAIVFDATKKYDIVISEVAPDPVALPAPSTLIEQSVVPSPI
jgi:hypothetical protein